MYLLFFWPILSPFWGRMGRFLAFATRQTNDDQYLPSSLAISCYNSLWARSCNFSFLFRHLNSWVFPARCIFLNCAEMMLLMQVSFGRQLVLYWIVWQLAYVSMCRYHVWPLILTKALKRAGLQVRKFIFVAPQRKLRPSKTQLCSLCFKLLDAFFSHNF